MSEFTSEFMKVAFSCLLSVGLNLSDRTIRQWDVETGICTRTLVGERLYEGMNIQGSIGLTNAQKLTLKELGAMG